MKQGSEMMKSAFTSTGRQDQRYVSLSEDRTELMWGPSRKSKKKRVLVSRGTDLGLLRPFWSESEQLSSRLYIVLSCVPWFAYPVTTACCAAAVGHYRGDLRAGERCHRPLPLGRRRCHA